MASILNTRTHNLRFSTFCGTAYTGAELINKNDSDRMQQSADKIALVRLSAAYDAHNQTYWGEQGAFTALKKMIGVAGNGADGFTGMAGNLAWTCRKFFSVAVPELPQCLLIESSTQEQSEPQGSQSPYCSNPLANAGFGDTHRQLHAAFGAAVQSVTPEKNGCDSFNACYANQKWDQTWSSFRATYGGHVDGAGKNVPGEFEKVGQEFSADWDAIEFGKGIYKWQECWLPQGDDCSEVLPFIPAYLSGWESFKTVMVDVWKSDFLKPELPRWQSESLSGLRGWLSAHFTWQAIPCVGIYSRPALENCIAKPRAFSDAYGTCVPGLINAGRNAGRFLLKSVVSPCVWLARALGSFVCDALITVTNVLYNGALGLTWALSWLAQAGMLLLDTIWQASKFLSFPLSKILGWSLTVLAYPLFGIIYGVVAATAWTIKASALFIRFWVQNSLLLLWNVLGRHPVWTLAHIAVLLKAGVKYTCVALQAFVGGAGRALGNFCGYVGGRVFYHLIRPAAEWSAKLFLLLARTVSHIGLGCGQLMHGAAKLAWHFALKPALQFLKWCAEHVASALKFTWNKLILPILFGGAVVIGFVASKVLLFVAFVVQIAVYPVVLVFGVVGVGLAFSCSEARLWLQSQWISKGMFGAYLRRYEAAPDFAIARQSTAYSQVPEGA